MLCDECIKTLAANISEEARKAFSVIQNNKCNKSAVMKKANLSYSIMQRATTELEAINFIKFKRYGSNKFYQLTKNGKRLIELYRKEVANA